MRALAAFVMAAGLVVRTVVVRMALILIPAVLMMPERHALAGRDSRRGLQRDHHCKQRNQQNADQVSGHRRRLYATWFDGSSVPWFRRGKLLGMRMGSVARKVTLTLHVSCSVGWFGAVLAFLALAIAGIAGNALGAYLAMAVVGWFVIVPLSVGSLVSGVVQALATPWGLFRHYWIVLKAVIALAATALLLAHLQPTTRLAETALQGSPDPGLQIRLLANAAAATFVLLVAVALGVFKPKGRIGEDVPRWLKLMILPTVALVAAFGLLHRIV